MIIVKNPSEFFDQSILLLKARPLTSRITNTYHVDKKTNKGLLTVKTYDPVSGALIKFRTTKAADIGRLMHILGRLGHDMAGVKEREVQQVQQVQTDTTTADVGGGGKASTTAGAQAAEGTSTPPAQAKAGGAGGGGGGGKKKKKGKK